MRGDRRLLPATAVAAVLTLAAVFALVRAAALQDPRAAKPMRIVEQAAASRPGAVRITERVPARRLLAGPRPAGSAAAAANSSPAQRPVEARRPQTPPAGVRLRAGRAGARGRSLHAGRRREGWRSGSYDRIKRAKKHGRKRRRKREEQGPVGWQEYVVAPGDDRDDHGGDDRGGDWGKPGADDESGGDRQRDD